MYKNKIKVAICSYDTDLGGPFIWLQRIVPELQSLGIECHCLFFRGIGKKSTALSFLEGVCRVSSVIRPNYMEDQVRWILSELKENPPSVFVPNLVLAGYYAARWVKAAGVPTIGIIHSDDSMYRAFQQEFIFGMPEFQLTDVVCVSGELERQVKDGDPASTRVHRIPYGVPIPSETVSRIAGRLRIAYVGRFVEEQKRISDVTRALCRVVREVKGAEAVMYGSGPDSGAVERILESEGSDLPIRLGGMVEASQIQKKLLECDVIVLLSDYEGLPISLLEGMACGCVPVCLRMRSGISELVEDGVNGFVVSNRNDGFVAAISRLAAQPEVMEQFSRRSRKKVLSHSTAACAAEWLDCMLQCTSQWEGSQQKLEIQVPARPRLPRTNPDLKCTDRRRPYLRQALVSNYRSLRRRAGLLRRRFFGMREDK